MNWQGKKCLFWEPSSETAGVLFQTQNKRLIRLFVQRILLSLENNLTVSFRCEVVKGLGRVVRDASPGVLLALLGSGGIRTRHRLGQAALRAGTGDD